MDLRSSVTKMKKLVCQYLLNSSRGVMQLLLDKVRHRVNNQAIFELTLHGFNHEDFTRFRFCRSQKNLMELSQVQDE